jgi:hypothetical protein
MYNRRDLLILSLSCGIVAGCLGFSSVVSQKTVTLFGLSVSVASVWFSFFTFPVTDIISNEYGKREAQLVVISGWVAMLLAAVMAFGTGFLPPTESFSEHEETLDFLTSSTWRVAAAGTVSYLVAQFLDIYLFAYLKARTDGKHLWLRNLVSTAISQTVNTAIIVIGIFAFILPPATIAYIFVSTVIVKMAIAVIDTPFVYLGVRLVRRIRS